LPSDEKKIVYLSHYGNRFGCNPKRIFDHIYKEKPTFKNVVVLNDQKKTPDCDPERVIYVSYYSISFVYHMATSGYWVVNTNLPPQLNPRKTTTYLQTWHGAGAFKKFGLDLPDSRQKEKESWKQDTSHWTKLITSSENVVKHYASACGISPSKIYPIGVPRNDLFFETQDTDKQKADFKKSHNIPLNKKILLYAPTYRDVEGSNPLNLDFQKLQADLGNEYVFILKLHPFLADFKLEEDNQEVPFVYNFSHFEDIQELLLIADALITDYSSVIFDYAITGNPILFYSYDLPEYERGFYDDYESFVPGPIAYTQSELTNYLKDYNKLSDRYHLEVIDFAKQHNAYFDGQATERAVELLLEK
jgi:CDP-glycerol glycerophosphotransferase (TagB/SpsB family)